VRSARDVISVEARYVDDVLSVLVDRPRDVLEADPIAGIAEEVARGPVVPRPLDAGFEVDGAHATTGAQAVRPEIPGDRSAELTLEVDDHVLAAAADG